MKIITYPSPVLRNKSRPIDISKMNEIKYFAKEMERALNEKDGLGLAASQVGKNIQLALIRTQEGVLALINPRLIKKSFSREVMEEGCLSVPHVFGLVKRPRMIKVETLTFNGQKKTISAHGLFARVIMHEIDHLNGILFIDKVKKITQGADLLKQYESTSKK